MEQRQTDRVVVGCWHDAVLSSDPAHGARADLAGMVELGTIVHGSCRIADGAAYLHLSHHTGEKSARTVASAHGLLVVDHGADGHAIGVEITAPLAVPLERLNSLLVELGETPLPQQNYLPLRVA